MQGRSEERRLITSLFIDVVGSTELTVNLGPERLKAALDQAFAELRAVIEGEGGTVEKYIGDAIYALFGAPIAHPDDPERALRAAAGARAWAASRVSATIPFGVRVGLETGEAIVDLAAAADTKQQMSVGAVVNTAARLQQRAEPGQVLVGPVTHGATAEIATFTPLGAVDLKGLGVMEVWALGEIRSSGSRQRLPFVGRASELELLDLAHRRAKTRSVLALVLGPPGQGKTRLVEEFLASRRGLRILSARCRPGGEVGALVPLRELLLGDRPPEGLEAIAAEAIADPAERAQVVEALAHSAGIRASASLSAVGKQERADELLNAWRRLVRGLAALGPLAIWVEDVHWAAPEVVSLVDGLSLCGEPVLVVATARPEFAEAAGLRPSGDRFFIELEGLEPEAARSLALSAGPLGTVLERAEGNPLFIVELARARDLGAGLPLTLQGALGARLDDLEAGDRSLLAHGAVIGETFDAADVAALAGEDVTVVARALSRLAERQYLEPVDRGHRFHHSLLRDVSYGRLLVADRMRLHARYARDVARPDDAEVLAHHWWAALGGDEARWVWAEDPELATVRRAAVAAHLAAGRIHAALFATDRAAEFFRRAHSLADREQDRGEARHALADAYAQELHGDEAWRAYRQAREHYTAAGSVPAEVYLGALKIRMRVGAFTDPPAEEDVAALAAEAEAAARAAGDPGLLARALVYTAFKDMDPSAAAGDPARLAEALELSERADARTRHEILGWYAGDLVREHQIERAVAVLDQMDAMPVVVSDFDRAEQLRGRAGLAEQRGDLAELRRHAEALVAVSRRMGPHLRTHADAQLGTLAFAAGDWETVIRLATDTDRLMQSSPGTPFCSAAGSLLARGAVAHGRAGRPDEARALARGIAMIGNAQERASLLTAIALLFIGTPVIGAPPPGSLVWSAVIAIASRQHDIALGLAAELDAQATGGARFYSAGAEATREEVARDRDGTVPRHALLTEIGYRGWSEVLGSRAVG